MKRRCVDMQTTCIQDMYICAMEGGFLGGKQLDDMLTQDLHILEVCKWIGWCM